DRDELHTEELGADHPVYRVGSTAADADDLNEREVLYVASEGHGSSLHDVQAAAPPLAVRSWLFSSRRDYIPQAQRLASTICDSDLRPMGEPCQARDHDDRDRDESREAVVLAGPRLPAQARASMLRAPAPPGSRIVAQAPVAQP